MHDKSRSPHYNSHDAGLLIAFTSLPLGKDQKFIREEIVDSFSKYRSNVADHAAPSEAEKVEYESTFFKPVSYICFGKFDAVHLALVDDLEFATRVFRPYNPLHHKPEREQEGYDFQVIFGPSGGNPEGKSLLKKANETFLRTQDRYPYIAICQLKINNTLLLGNGASLVYYVQCLIEETIGQFRQDPAYAEFVGEERSVCDFMVTESFSYQELVVVLFGNSYAHLSKLILRVREYKFEDLMRFHSDDPNWRRHFGIFVSNAVGERLRKFETTDLGNRLIEEGTGRKTKGILSNHLFNSSATAFGYHFDLYKRPSIDDSISKSSDDSINHHPRVDGHRTQPGLGFLREMDSNARIQSNWFVKPGHISELVKLIAEVEANLPMTSEKSDAGGDDAPPPYEISIGKGDLLYPFWNGHGMEMGGLKRGMTFVEEGLLSPRVIQQIYEVISYPSVLIDDKFISNLGETTVEQHYEAAKILRKLTIKSETIKHVNSRLKALAMPSVLTEKITTIFSTFNTAIQDRLLYSSFLELRNFVVHVLIGTVENYFHWKDHPDFLKYRAEDVLFSLTEAFEVAYRNRISHTYWSAERTEFSLDYRGGIHVILSAWDAAYKALSKPLGERDNACSFVYVSGYSGVVSLPYALKLNYSHIFLPSIYLCVAGHEAANHFLTKLLESQGRNRAPIHPMFDRSILYRFFSKAGIQPHEFPAEGRLGAEAPLLRYPSSESFFLKDQTKHWMEAFLLYLRPEFYRYLIVDTITYYYVFHGDSTLFWHYSWGYLLQMARAYSKPNQLDKQLFLLMLMRLVFVLERFDPGFLTIANMPSRILKNYWESYFDRCCEFAKILLNPGMPELRDWLGYFQGLAAHVVFEAHDELASFEMQEETCRLSLQSEEALGRLTEKLRKESIKNFSQPILDGIPKPYKDLDGKKNPSKYASTQFVSKQVYAYLKVVHDYSMGVDDKSAKSGKTERQTGKEVLLNREDESGVVNIDKQDSAKILIDPFGGYFTHDLKVRRDFFKFRTTLMKSLWDLSMVEKADFVLDTLKERSYLDWFDEGNRLVFLEGAYRWSVEVKPLFQAPTRGEVYSNVTLLGEWGELEVGKDGALLVEVNTSRVLLPGAIFKDGKVSGKDWKLTLNSDRYHIVQESISLDFRVIARGGD